MNEIPTTHKVADAILSAYKGAHPDNEAALAIRHMMKLFTEGEMEKASLRKKIDALTEEIAASKERTKAER